MGNCHFLWMKSTENHNFIKKNLKKGGYIKKTIFQIFMKMDTTNTKSHQWDNLQSSNKQ